MKHRILVAALLSTYARLAFCDAPECAEHTTERAVRDFRLADETLRRANTQFTDIFPCNDGAAKTAPVRSYRFNAFGIYDMEGNVSEWVADCWTDELEREPSSPPGAACGERVIRGGNWGLSPQHERIANRMRNTPDTPLSSVGFRVARDL